MSIWAITAAAAMALWSCKEENVPQGDPDVGTQDVVSGDAGDASGVGGDAADGAAEAGTDTTSAPGELSIDPGELLYRGVAKDESETRQINLRNIGDSEIVVTELTVDEDDPAGADDGEFEVATESGDAFPLAIKPDIAETVEVTYNPTDYAVDKATLTATTRSSEVDDVEVPIRTILAHPDLRGPELVRFGTVEEGDEKRRQILVHNRGTEELVIDGVRVEREDNFSVEFPRESPTVRLDEGESFMFEVLFEAPDSDKRTGEVVIESNDPDQMSYRIDVSANRPKPCLAISTDAIDFGSIGAGEGTQELGILNCNLDRSLTVESVGFLTDGGGAFSLENPPTFPTTIQAAQETRLTVVADLDEERERYGTLVIRSDDTDRNPLLIEVRANVGE